MRKCLWMLLILACLLALAACGPVPGPAPTDGADAAPAEPLPEETPEAPIPVIRQPVENPVIQNPKVPQPGAAPEEQDQDGPELAFTARYFRTNGYHEDVSYPAARVIDSKAALDAYIAENEDRYNFFCPETASADAAAGFAEAATDYDEAWFAEHQLVLVLLEEGSGSTRHAVTRVSGPPTSTVAIQRHVPLVGTADMAEWHILLELERAFSPEDEITVALTVAKQ